LPRIIGVAAEDRERWDARHAAVSAAGAADVPMPPDALRGREHLLPNGGRALDVACGRGSVAGWLAERGFVVDAVDISEAAVAAGAALAADRGVAERVRWWRYDLDAGLPGACAGPYDVVVCQRFRDPALYPVLAQRLAPGGLLVLTVQSVVGDEPGRFRASPGELLAAFAELTTLHHTESDGQARLLARRR
jgi:2-polyprenyl-3-methyl-5-hydroxy-6-metoxy-1,4-benzoquinol methylase